MALSKFLKKRINNCQELVNLLKNHFAYVSILGSDTTSTYIRVDKKATSISDGFEKDCGFVVKMADNDFVFEYSVTDIVKVDKIYQEILNEYQKQKMFQKTFKHFQVRDEEKLVQDFVRPNDLNKYSDTDLMTYLSNLKDEVVKKDENILNVFTMLQRLNVSKIFVSP